MRRIVCVGNALCDGDRAGPAAYERLRRSPLPRGVEVLDGGLAGLELLGAFEGAERVVFIDSVRGFGAPGEVVVLAPGEAAAGGFDHAGGLAYVLGVYRAVLPAPHPEVSLVGVEEPMGPASADEAARRAVALCTEARHVA